MAEDANILAAVREASPNFGAKIILALKISENRKVKTAFGEKVPAPNRELALELAHLMSAEQAQTFYKLAVLVTKLR